MRCACRTSRRAPTASATRNASIDALGIHGDTIEISAAVDGYLQFAPDADPRRRGNVMARMRMLVLFDQSAKLDALPVGTGNKTERLLGYFTWHADDSPPVNPLGDLFKTQVWALARYLGVPAQLIDKAPSADLEADQTDEGDLGISYARADAILTLLLQGYATPASRTTGSRTTRSHSSGGASTVPIGNAICRRPRCSRAPRSTNSTCAPSTTGQKGRRASRTEPPRPHRRPVAARVLPGGAERRGTALHRDRSRGRPRSERKGRGLARVRRRRRRGSPIRPASTNAHWPMPSW